MADFVEKCSKMCERNDGNRCHHSKGRARASNNDAKYIVSTLEHDKQGRKRSSEVVEELACNDVDDERSEPRLPPKHVLSQSKLIVDAISQSRGIAHTGNYSPKEEEEHVASDVMPNVLSDYLYDTFGNLETNWLDPLPLDEESNESTWLLDVGCLDQQKGEADFDIAHLGCGDDRHQFENPLYCNTHLILPQDTWTGAQLDDDDLKGIIDSLESRIQEAITFIQSNYHQVEY